MQAKLIISLDPSLTSSLLRSISLPSVCHLCPLSISFSSPSFSLRFSLYLSLSLSFAFLRFYVYFPLSLYTPLSFFVSVLISLHLCTILSIPLSLTLIYVFMPLVFEFSLGYNSTDASQCFTAAAGMWSRDRGRLWIASPVYLSSQMAAGGLK
jgi:hypothetical protein